MPDGRPTRAEAPAARARLRNVDGRWRARAGIAAGLAASVLYLPLAAACPLGPEALHKDGYELAFRSDASLAIGRHFELEIEICGSDGTPYRGRLAVDATMPMHGHGMNYAPRVARLGPGRFRAEGYLLHMPGSWRFTFVVGEARPVRIASEVEVR